MNAYILAHGAAEESIQRHITGWEKSFEDVTFICPENDGLRYFDYIAIGESCRNGEGAIERIKVAIESASEDKTACVMEYDTIFRAGKLPDDGWKHNAIICSSIFDNYDPAFSAPIYGHSPWITSGMIWKRILDHGEDLQDGWPDRWLANAARKAGIKLLGMNNAYSYDGEWTSDILAEALNPPRAVYHGVKTKEAYESLVGLASV